MRVLIAGGAGYIGATVASACLDAGHEPVVLDDLSTGAGAFVAGRRFVAGGIQDGDVVDAALAALDGIDAAILCAAHIVVPESVHDPLRYYRNNVAASVAFLEHLRRNGCRRVLFSSSAAVYAPADDFGVSESSPVVPASPYAHTKAMVERILADAAAAGLVQAVALRYFNPIGADPQLRTGQQRPAPTHALGRLLEAQRTGTPFTVNGTDWPTRDGTGLRDYVHVWDLARAHVHALERFDALVARPGSFTALNVGTGSGTTVRELVAAFVSCAGPVAVIEGPRRAGDVAGAFARVERAHAELEWRAELSVVDGVRDALAWAAVRDDVLRRDEFSGGDVLEGDEFPRGDGALLGGGATPLSA